MIRPLAAAAGLLCLGAAAQPHANYVETIRDTKVTFDMVAIPGGTFSMGSPAGEKGREAGVVQVGAVDDVGFLDLAIGGAGVLHGVEVFHAPHQERFVFCTAWDGDDQAS